MLTSKDLSLVEAVARTGKLLAAARELRIDHSTVFRQLAALEQRVGGRLFDRDAGGYRATPLGQHIAEFAARWTAELASLQRVVRTAPGEVAGSVRITTTEDLALGVLPPVLLRLAQQHPLLHTQVFVDNQLRDLQRHEADVALRPTREPPAGLVGKDLGALPTAVYASREQAKSLGASSLADAPSARWIARIDAAGPSRDHRWMKSRVPDAQVVASFSGFAPYLEAARAGVGLALLPCLIGDADDRLLRVGEPIRELTSRLWVLCTAELRRNPTIRAVFRCLARS